MPVYFPKSLSFHITYIYIKEQVSIHFPEILALDGGPGVLDEEQDRQWFLPPNPQNSGK